MQQQYFSLILIRFPMKFGEVTFHGGLAINPVLFPLVIARRREGTNNTILFPPSFFFKVLFFYSSFRLTAKLRGQYSFHMAPAPTHAQPSPLSTVPAGVAHLLQLINLHWHIISTQSPYFTLWSILDIVHSMGLAKCIMTCIDHYGIMQSIFIKILGASSIHHHLHTWQPLILKVFMVLPCPDVT